MFKYAAALALAGSAVATASAADDSALIDILQRKGVLSKKEADSVREELSHSTNDSASKIKLSPAVSELKIYGDIRERFQYESKDNQLTRAQGGGNNVSQQNRWRFRLRLDAEFKLGENVFGGVELSTQEAADSGNQTYQDGFNKYGIYISKAYMGWKPTDWLTLTGGKLANPFYTTDLVWDPDINPTGATEVIAFHKLVAPEAASAGYSKDGKTMKEVVASELPWELSLVAGQFIYDDNAENAGPDSDSSTDAYLFETQLIGSYKFGGTKVTFAPAWLTYINGSLSGLNNNNAFNDPAAGVAGTRDINLLLAPGDVSFKLGDLKTKLYWDFSYNIDGAKRVQDIYGLRFAANNPSQHKSEDDFAWLLGVQLGENKKAGDWSVLANYRQTGLGAVDPNLNDSDFAAGELNTRGFKVGMAYSLSDFATFGVAYMYAWNLRDSLFGGQVTGGQAIGDSNNVQVLQVDLSVKF